MSTRSTTTIFDESNCPLLSFYRHCDGYFEGHGEELKQFLTDFKITNGIGGNDTNKVANGMGCLAAQIIKHFKLGVGGIYIINHTQREEYNYSIRLVNGKLQLSGSCKSKNDLIENNFDLQSTLKYTEIAKFVYPRSDGEMMWREVGIIESDDSYIKGIDLEDNKFKCFRCDKIVGGKKRVICEAVMALH